ncbi:MAG: HAMP domain-containing protein [Sphingomonadales bacterium]|nr:HAMP domain-containing protein [Sphingomonadales bacterium]
MVGAIAVLIILLAAVGISTYFIRDIVRRMAQLRFAIAEMADGNFDIVLPGLDRKDELGEISDVIDALVEAPAELRRDRL